MARKTKQMISSAVLLVFFIIVVIIVLFPIYYLIIGSLQPSREIFRTGMKLVYDSEIMGFNNYKLLIDYRDGVYFSWLKNSILIAGLFTVCALFFSSLVGYGLGVYDFKYKNIIFTLVLVVMMIPLEILMLPLYKLTVQLKIINTYAGVILPFMVSPIAIFFFRQYSSGISRDFLDAGRIDGCTEIGIYFKIMVPLMKPAFGAMTILLAMQNWNSFVWPLIVLRDNEMFTLPIGLSSLISPYGNNFDVMIAGAVIAIAPIIILFLFNQRFFIAGLTSGGIKG
jgi:arabinosaccharide transport system permease protein